MDKAFNHNHNNDWSARIDATDTSPPRVNKNAPAAPRAANGATVVPLAETPSPAVLRAELHGGARAGAPHGY